MTIIRHLIRFIVAAIVLLIISWIVPGFNVEGFWTALVAAVVIAAIGWGIEALLGPKISPYSRGIIGFLVSAVVIYVTQYLVADYQATVVGSLIAAAIIGIIDAFVPIKPRLGSPEEIKER
jgi:putative membrane protein